jgi:AcrR family transcriptional regulator
MVNGLTDAAAATGRSGTRARILQVALELFVAQGYEKTSLREIAERLGVTKAALYYHFKTKEDIARSIVDDYIADLAAIFDWGATQPRTRETRRELLRRYAAVITTRKDAMRFFQQNPALRHEEVGERFHEQMRRLLDLFRDPGDPLVNQVRAVVAGMSVNAGTFFALANLDDAPPVDEADAAALEVALQVLDLNYPGES